VCPSAPREQTLPNAGSQLAQAGDLARQDRAAEYQPGVTITKRLSNTPLATENNKGVSMKFRKPAAALVMAALTLGSVFSLTGVAYASAMTMSNVNTKRCLDDSFGYGLRSLGCNGLKYQLWNLTNKTWDDTWAFENVTTQRCLDDSPEYGLRSHACNGLDYQQWRPSNIFPWNRLTNVHTGRCIDDSFGSGLRSFTCNNLDYQGWVGF
jgi:hypothetical protein